MLDSDKKIFIAIKLIFYIVVNKVIYTIKVKKL